MGDTILINTIEVTELRNDLPSSIDNDDFVCLIRRRPDVVVFVDDDSIGAVNAVDEDRWFPSASVEVHRNLNDLVIPCIRNEHCGTGIVELDTVGAKRRYAGRSERRVLDPYRSETLRPRAARRTSFPDNALERIRCVDVTMAVECERIEPRHGWVGAGCFRVRYASRTGRHE